MLSPKIVHFCTGWGHRFHHLSLDSSQYCPLRIIAQLANLSHHLYRSREIAMMGTWENEPRKRRFARRKPTRAAMVDHLRPGCRLNVVLLHGGPRTQLKYVGLCRPLWRNRRVRWRFGSRVFGSGGRRAPALGAADRRARAPHRDAFRVRRAHRRDRRPLFTHDVAPFVVFRILQGAGFSAVTTASATAAADALPASRMGKESATTGLARRFPCRLDPPSPSPSCRPIRLRTSLSA